MNKRCESCYNVESKIVDLEFVESFYTKNDIRMDFYRCTKCGQGDIYLCNYDMWGSEYPWIIECYLNEDCNLRDMIKDVI